jgi:CBS domain-containing protein
MSIQNVLDRNRAEVVTISPTDTVKNAADRMRAHDIAALVVKSGAAITGLISDRETQGRAGNLRSVSRQAINND